jgi:hypothetical protein
MRIEDPEGRPFRAIFPFDRSHRTSLGGALYSIVFNPAHWGDVRPGNPHRLRGGWSKIHSGG